MTLNEDFDTWSSTPPAEMAGDPIWRLPAFRMGRFLANIARADRLALVGEPDHSREVEQLLRSIDSIPANIAEGYSRYSGRERARFYEIALGSAREAREWYGSLRVPLGEHKVAERLGLLTRVVKILTKAIPQERVTTIPTRRRSSETEKG